MRYGPSRTAIAPGRSRLRPRRSQGDSRRRCLLCRPDRRAGGGRVADQALRASRSPQTPTGGASSRRRHRNLDDGAPSPGPGEPNRSAPDPTRRILARLPVQRAPPGPHPGLEGTRLGGHEGGDGGRDPLFPGADVSPEARPAWPGEHSERPGATPHPRGGHADFVPASRRGARREIVIGTIVLAPAGTPFRKNATPELFRDLDAPGFAKATMSFLVEDTGDGTCTLQTETRVHATDGTARRRFAAYWRMIYPGSALIRRMWLRAIMRRAEEASP